MCSALAASAGTLRDHQPAKLILCRYILQRTPSETAVALTGNPPRKADEEELHGGAEPERSCGFATNSDAGPSRADVGRKHSKKKQNKSDSSGASCQRKQQTDGACNLAQASEIHQSARPRKRRRHHANEVVPHASKMSARRQEKHCRERT